MELPEILAGPILRRVEATRACVWIATKHRMRVEGYVYEADSLNVLGRGESVSLSFGRNLFVALVQIVPSSNNEGQTAPKPYPRNVLLAYDLVLTPLNESTKEAMTGYGVRLTEHKEMRGEIGIAYPPHRLPTFFLPEAGTFNILHGSCRKPHGPGQDALSIADILIKNGSDNKSLALRPSALFLTGDQIYADDVDNGLISVIDDLGPSLLGTFEEIPLPNGGAIPISKLNQPEGIRGQLIKDLFSPDNKKDRLGSRARNQLIGFSDFAAMYLLAWNAALWPKNIRGSDKRIEGMRSSLPRTRRALANIPTYMIMDDHEITDDWNITYEWEQRVRGSATGRRIVANGLAAYWLFQAWGNQPDNDTFSKDFIDILVGYLSRESKVENDEYETALLSPSNPKQWSFSAPTDPPVFVFDSRTRREKDQSSENLPSALMSEGAIQDLVSEVKKWRLSENWSIVISQTPIFGNPAVEQFIETHGAKEPPASVYTYDDETWHANRPGFYKLLRALHSVAPADGGWLVLSGDVHYAFVAKASVTVGEKTVPFIQFTSSALKNGLTTSVKDLGLQAILYVLGDPGAGALNKTVEYDSDLVVTNQPIPSQGGGYLFQKPNLGQVFLLPAGKATLNLYMGADATPAAVYVVQVASPR
jgi:hypothetical protein